MTFDLLHLLHKALFGALAASGFGILFNLGWRELPWCAASGALALATRTLGQDAGWTVEAASFTAAAAVGCAGRVLRASLGIASTALAVSGCIPMVPGASPPRQFPVCSSSQRRTCKIAMTTMEFTLRVIFTIGAIGAGLSIATHIFRSEVHD